MIRPAVPGDAAALAQLHLQSWRETYPGIVPDDYLAKLSLPDRVEAWKANLDGGSRFNFVAEEAGRLQGFSSGGPLRGDAPAGADGECYAVYVLKDWQGRGLGRALFDAVAAELRRRGFKAMATWVLKDNRKARGFYEAMGGAPAGSSKVLIGRELETAAYLQRL